MDSDKMVKNILRKIRDMKSKHILNKDALKSSLSKNEELLERQRELYEQISETQAIIDGLN